MTIDSFLHNGVEVKRCRRAKPRKGTAQLYCSQGGKSITEQPRFVSVTRRTANVVKPTYRPDRPSKKNGGHANYMHMEHFGSIPCHILVYETWVGERTPGMQIDHINGVTTDNRVYNLQQVTPAENMRRTRYIRALREILPHHYQTYQREDYLRFFAMPFDEFQALLSRYTRAPCSRYTIDPRSTDEIMLFEMQHPHLFDH